MVWMLVSVNKSISYVLNVKGAEGWEKKTSRFFANTAAAGKAFRSCEKMFRNLI
jgi:hypothetical protein